MGSRLIGVRCCSTAFLSLVGKAEVRFQQVISYFSRLLRPVSTLCSVYAWESVLLVSLITLSILFRSVGRSASSGHLSLFRWLPRSRVANQPIHWAIGWVFLLLVGVWGDGGGSVCLPLYSSSPPGGASLFLGVPCWFFSLISVFRLVFLGLRGHKPQAAEPVFYGWRQHL